MGSASMLRWKFIW